MATFRIIDADGHVQEKFIPCMERLDEHYEYLRPTVPWLTKRPSEYMRSEQVYYSFEPDERTLGFVIDFVGEERLVFASDYNHENPGR